ncbi:ATP synthase subunit K [Treponema endosymbiont of Eucomonympha sp.]|uniref:ATP synthase subunit K n=1 Tax=Treponema endosymbiont of Eucomonympha sp. TaxID=1580831 RepID=UPI00075096B8|nr:ATP synthase subunit K [Treponema endosymbiont of Eucomonympha sp.]
MDLGQLSAGVVMGIAAIGSGIGICTAGQASVGAWKRCFLNNKPAPMVLITFAGAPLTQIFYGFILMGSIAKSAKPGEFLLGLGVVSGLALAISAVVQGKVAAAAADAQGETGKGFAQYIAVVGICETVALFAMVLSMVSC